MSESTERITELIYKFLKAELNPLEKTELDSWISTSDANRQIFEKLTDNSEFNHSLQEIFTYKQKAWKVISENIGVKKVVPMYQSSFMRWVAAASILIILSTGAYFLFFNNPEQQVATTETQQIKNDVPAPASNRATITLANGKQILLDSAGVGTLAKEGNVNVVKLADGQIAYNGPSTSSGFNEIQYNFLTNPRGSKVINLKLADGSIVWLNAQSTLKYPIAFSGNERKVEITGEAYFEVAHNASKKFIVSSNGTNTEVLGTHFNVNSYGDDGNIKVTLLEGSVKVSNGASSGILKPGQQAQINSEIKLLNNVDMGQIMAWKNGLFSFDNADIRTIMKEVSRWYDVDVVYTTEVKELFRLKTSRNTSVSNIFKALEAIGGVHLEVNGKKIIVKP